MSSLSFRPKLCDNEHIFLRGPRWWNAPFEVLFLKYFQLLRVKKSLLSSDGCREAPTAHAHPLKKPQKRSSRRQTTLRRPPVKLPSVLLMLEDTKWTLNGAQTLSIGPASVYTAAATSRTLMQMLHLFQSVWNGSPKWQITANYQEAQAVASPTISPMSYASFVFSTPESCVSTDSAPRARLFLSKR